MGAECEATIAEAVTPDQVDSGGLQGQQLAASGSVPQIHTRGSPGDRGQPPPVGG